jgi:ElaB/YqjD/DUF883 family membrane-anchored ribosome-binding protein
MINGSGTQEHRETSKKMEAFASMGDVLEDSKAKVNEFAENVSENMNETKVEAERRIKAKPLQYVAGATIGGALIGYLLGRKR